LLASRHYSFASTPPYVAAGSTEDSSEKDDENMRKKKGSAESVVPDKKTDLQVPIGSGACA